MNINKILYNIGTLGPVGYLPAPGTVATLISFIFFYYFKINLPVYIIISGISLTIIDILLIKDDPKEIVIDEVVGSALIFLSFTTYSYSLYQIILSFIIFRLLDIYKPLGIKYIEELPGAAGIIGDDIAAAAFTILFVQIITWIAKL